jgi:hypothetical protein
MKYVAFDIETYGSVEHPEGITCAATLTEDGELRIWKPSEGDDGRYKPRMEPEQLVGMLDYLENEWIVNERRPLAFNGMSFDFRVLHEQLLGHDFGQALARGLALVQLDPALHMLAEKGFMCGLQAMSAAMGASGKLEGFDGHKAAELWMTGTREDQEMILKYVAQDVVTTREVYEAICRVGAVRWVKRNGGIGQWIPGTRSILSAKDVIERGFVGRPPWWTGDSYPWTKENVLGWLAPK